MKHQGLNQRHLKLIVLGIVMLFLTLSAIILYSIWQENKKEPLVQKELSRNLLNAISSSIEYNFKEQFSKKFKQNNFLENSSLIESIDGIILTTKDHQLYPEEQENDFFIDLEDFVSIKNLEIYQGINQLIANRQFKLAIKKSLSAESDIRHQKDLLLFYKQRLVILNLLKLKDKRQHLAKRLLLLNEKSSYELPWFFWESIFIIYSNNQSSSEKEVLSITTDIISFSKTYWFKNDMDYFLSHLKKFPSNKVKSALNLNQISSQWGQFKRIKIISSEILKHHTSTISKLTPDSLLLKISHKNKTYYLTMINNDDETSYLIVLSWPRLKVLLEAHLQEQKKDSDRQYFISEGLSDEAFTYSPIENLPGLFINMKYTANNGWRSTNQQKNIMIYTIMGLSFLLVIFSLTAFYRLIINQIKLTKMRNDFISNISHELRTPVSAIQIMSETIVQKRVFNPSDLDSFNKIILDESQKLTRLINKILDFAQLESGEKKYYFSKTNLKEFLQQLSKAFIKTHTHKSIAFNIDCKDDATFSFDQEAMEQIFLNLFENSTKYTLENNVKINLTILLKNENVIILIKDGGRGISKEELPHVFDKFYRGGNIMTQSISGNGLGLNIVKELVEAHQGNISISSETDQGTTVTLTFKLNPNE